MAPEATGEVLPNRTLSRHDPSASILFIFVIVPWIKSPRLSLRRRVCEKGKSPNLKSTALLQAFTLAIISSSVENCRYTTTLAE
jgi:hypothetical protein